MGRDLARLQAALLLNQGAGYHFGRVNTKSNVIANGISCIPSKTSLSHEFPLLLARISSAPPTGPQLAWLSVLPPECHPHLINYGSPIVDRLHGSSQCKQAVTDQSRKIHFLSWCHDIGLPDPCTPELPLQGHNWIIACYAVALVHRRTITGVRIRHATLLGCIKQAVALHTDRGLPNPHHVDINYIKVMTNSVKKYESVPKRKEMFSDSMFITSLSSPP
jgi:hypothetical protein